MNLRDILSLEVGTSVNWINPDEPDSGPYHLQEILTPSGRIEDITDSVILSDRDGHAAEALVVELA